MALPPSFDKLRIGETFRIVASGRNQLNDDPIAIDNPDSGNRWDSDQNANTGTRPFSINTTTGLVTPERPGSDIIRFRGKDVIGDLLAASQAARVLDMSALVIDPGILPDPERIFLVDGVLEFIPQAPDFISLSTVITAIPIDERGQSGSPAYTITDFLWSVDNTNVLTLEDETANPTNLSANAVGETVLRASGKNSAGETITVAMRVIVVGVTAPRIFFSIVAP